ncbi:putative odorant receptor 69a [Odontomachus brunneus]|uniref:putative odorant receptor 69a n=1 Tax=Odontomachus brunneus TaxID=486640 RepID=UPI0013F18397|nr:putative odorant receptor 69a [Odontomachus brunneus]
MFQVFQVVTFGGKVEEFFLHLACIIPILVYMFNFSYLGQEITDDNDNVFLSTYNVCWYAAPLSIQKLILILLQRGSKPYTWSAAGF